MLSEFKFFIMQHFVMYDSRCNEIYILMYFDFCKFVIGSYMNEHRDT